MAMHLPLDKDELANEANLRSRATALVSPLIDFFRPIRQITNTELLVKGQPAPEMIFDRARRNRHQPEVEAAEAALKTARDRLTKPYALAGEIARWARDETAKVAVLAGWAGLALAGAALSIGTALQATAPDSVLLEHATRLHQATPPTAANERHFLMTMAGIGVLLVIAGLYNLMKRWLLSSTSRIGG